MKLQMKTNLILIVLLVLVVVVISSFITVISFSSYSALEQEYVAQDIHQAVSRVNDEMTTLSSIVSDWAPWDDTYAFVNGNKPEYLKKNLMPESTIYENLQLNLIVITDSRGGYCLCWVL